MINEHKITNTNTTLPYFTVRLYNIFPLLTPTLSASNKKQYNAPLTSANNLSSLSSLSFCPLQRRVLDDRSPAPLSPSLRWSFPPTVFSCDHSYMFFDCRSVSFSGCKQSETNLCGRRGQNRSLNDGEDKFERRLVARTKPVMEVENVWRGRRWFVDGRLVVTVMVGGW